MGRLGINAVHLDMKEIEALGLGRVEFVLARGRDYGQMLEDILAGVAEARDRGLSYSIHLPIYLFDWYQDDYLSAYYLDPDESRRALAFRFLEANLERLSGCGASYYILHFPGVYRYIQETGPFQAILEDSLRRLDELAARYGIRLLLEYFGSNFSFWRIDEWIERLAGCPHLGILCDTGHLYFSSVLHGFDFYDALGRLGPHAEAFHLWTTFSGGAYSDSESYRRYHHIAMHTAQKESEGFAFDAQKALELIRMFNRPTIIEASDRYGGREYFIEGIRTLVDFFD